MSRDKNIEQRHRWITATLAEGSFTLQQKHGIFALG